MKLFSHHSIATSDDFLGDPLFLAARRPYQEPSDRHDLGHMDVKC